MTLGLAFIGLLFILVIVSVIMGIKKDDDYFGATFILLIVLGGVMGARHVVNSTEEQDQLCIEKGFQSIQIFDKKVCVLN